VADPQKIKGPWNNEVFPCSLPQAMNKYPTIMISKLKRIVGERVELLTRVYKDPLRRMRIWRWTGVCGEVCQNKLAGSKSSDCILDRSELLPKAIE
jgi:hypothetical protein